MLEIRNDLPSVNPELPYIVADKKFDPDDFGLPETAQFNKIKSKSLQRIS